MSGLEGQRPTERFTDRVADYVRFRPTYPSAAIDLVLSGLGDPARVVAADVGAGTGISARLLADRGLLVHAVEPNAAMRAAATPHPRVVWHDGRAEATGLPAASVDLVVCAQAYHWFDVPEARAELRRILRPGGRLALLWNRKDAGDPFTRAYGALVEAATEPGQRAIATWSLDPAPFPAAGFTVPHLATVANRQRLDEEGLVGRALSASYVPKSGPRHEALVQGLRALHRRLRDATGQADLVYRTDVWTAIAC